MKTDVENGVGRRDFLGKSAAAVVSALLPAARGAQLKPAAGKQDRLACNSWPFRAYFDTPQMHQYRDAKFPLIGQAEFPAFLADHFGIHNVEFLPQHFADTDASTIDKVKAGLKKARSRCCNLMGVEIAGGVYNAEVDRQSVRADAERWTGVAVALGCPSITVALTGKEPANAELAANTLKPFVETAQARGIKVLFHNDNIKLESAETLVDVIKRLGSGTGTCPDFGNFATRSAAYALAQLRMLTPYAGSICHAKDGIADNGKFYEDDFAASMKVMRDAGFKGLYSLEFENLGAPLEGVRKLMQLTEEHLG